ncbi:hypothetical protein [Mesorhizobium australicum]|uniref:hypothetical protein n=1 Tax=Mesorhizobium australicum TaxID=536018 RepID=UPI003334EB95
MTKYQVEEIESDTVVSSGIVVENDPMKAAEATAGQRVSPRALQDHWFRVVDEEQAAVYEYSLAGPDQRLDLLELNELTDLGPPLPGKLHGARCGMSETISMLARVAVKRSTCAICGKLAGMKSRGTSRWSRSLRRR